MRPSETLSIVLPAKDEAAAIEGVVARIRELHPEAELLVVDDGSADATAHLAARAGATVVSHPYPKGNGAAVKTGIRKATGDIILLMDADGQHRPEDIGTLLEGLRKGFDMVVGSRSRAGQAGAHRALANRIYNRIASWMVEHEVMDLTSGFRAFRSDAVKRYLYMLPNGFSYPSTITLAYFRAGLSVKYVPVEVLQRSGSSHVRILRDGIRFLLIMFRIVMLYSPLKVFFPVSAAFICTAIAYSGYTIAALSRFTNMSALLFISGILIFLIGLVSEQITMLHYSRSDS